MLSIQDNRWRFLLTSAQTWEIVVEPWPSLLHKISDMHEWMLRSHNCRPKPSSRDLTISELILSSITSVNDDPLFKSHRRITADSSSVRYCRIHEAFSPTLDTQARICNPCLTCIPASWCLKFYTVRRWWGFLFCALLYSNNCKPSGLSCLLVLIPPLSYCYRLTFSFESYVSPHTSYLQM